MNEKDLIRGSLQRWDVPVNFKQSDDGTVQLSIEALHPGIYREGTHMEVNLSPEIIMRSADSFNGVDLMAGHPPADDPSDPKLVCGSVRHSKTDQAGNLIVNGSTFDTELGKQQANLAKQGRLQASIGAYPVYDSMGKLHKLAGDHIAFVRKNHAEDKKATIHIAMSKIGDESLKMANDNKGQGAMIQMNEEDFKKELEAMRKEKEEILLAKAEMLTAKKEMESGMAQLKKRDEEANLASLASTRKDLVAMAKSNKLDDIEKELNEIELKDITEKELDQFHIKILSAAQKNMQELGAHRQDPLMLGANQTGIGLTPEQMLNMTKEKAVEKIKQLARSDMHRFFTGARKIRIMPASQAQVPGAQQTQFAAGQPAGQLQFADDYIMEGVDAKGGYMTSPELAQRIIDYTSRATHLSRYYTFEPMISKVKNISKVLASFLGDMKHVPETGAFGEPTTMSAGLVSLNARKLMCQKLVSTEIEEDWNVEGGALDKTMQLIGEAFSQSLEYVALYGDTTTYDPAASNDIRAMCDGIYKTCPAEHIINLAGEYPTLKNYRYAMSMIENSGGDVLASMMNPGVSSYMKDWKEAETNPIMMPDGRKIEGRVAVIDGSDILKQRLMPLDTTSYPTKTVGDIVLLGSGAASYGARRKMTMFKEYVSDNDVFKVTSTGRFAWQDLTEQDDDTSRVAIITNARIDP